MFPTPNPRLPQARSLCLGLGFPLPLLCELCVLCDLCVSLSLRFPTPSPPSSSPPPPPPTHPPSLAHPQIHILQIQPVRIRIALHRHAMFRASRQHLFHVVVQRLPSQQHPPRRMPDDLRVRILNRRQHPFRHRLPPQIEIRMDRAHHHIQLRQQ